MLGARVGAVLIARKQGYSLTSRKSDAEELKELAELEHHEHIEDFDVKENNKQKLVFRKYPFIEWGVGAAFFATFAFSEMMIQIVNVENNNNKLLHSWTQLFLLSFCLFGCMYSLYEGEIESISIDKKTETLLIKYTNILCKKRYHCHAIGEILNIKAVQKGRKGPSETQHYILCIYLRQGQMIKVLFSKNP